MIFFNTTRLMTYQSHQRASSGATHSQLQSSMNALSTPLNNPNCSTHMLDDGESLNSVFFFRCRGEEQLTVRNFSPNQKKINMKLDKTQHSAAIAGRFVCDKLQLSRICQSRASREEPRRRSAFSTLKLSCCVYIYIFLLLSSFSTFIPLFSLLKRPSADYFFDRHERETTED